MLMTALKKEQLEPLREALVRARLPVNDLDYPGRCFFMFSLQGIDMAFGGIEGEGADRLLRSLVVLDGHRGRGIGATVLATLEVFAKREGVVRLHLLTDTATAFFVRQGYRVRDRSLAPALISATAQFRTLCPATAAYLSKRLA